MCLGLLDVAQPGFELTELAECLGATGLQFLALAQQPAPFVVGGAGVQTQSAELFINRRDGGIGFVERGQRLLSGILAGGLLAHRPGQRRAELVGIRLRRLQFRTRLGDFGGELQRRRFAVGATADPAGADQIAIAGDRTQLRTTGDQVHRFAQSADDGDTGQHGDQRAAQPRRRLDQVEGPLRAVGKRAYRRGLVGGPVAQHDGRSTAVGPFERGHRLCGRAEAVGGQRVGCRTEHDGQRGLKTRLHRDQLGELSRKFLHCSGFR